MMLAGHDEATLMQQIASGQQAALAALYERWGSLVFSLALRVLQNHALAEEATQDVFLKLWNHPDRWDPQRGPFISWLLVVTRNTAIDRLRAEQRQEPPRNVPLDDAPMVADPSGVAGDAQWADGQVLRALLRQLPLDQRTLIEMAFFQGLTHSQLADRTGLPLGTVKTRVRLGLQKLRAGWQEAHRHENTEELA